jgi:hypothetical protein
MKQKKGRASQRRKSRTSSRGKMSERKQREERLRNRQGGSWGTTSTMYFHAVELVFRESAKVVAGDPTRTSRWVYAGLPVLMAGLEAFLIEHQHLLNDSSNIQILAGVDPVRDVLKLYPMSDELRQDLMALIEVRNQIVHPSPVPFGKPEWPKSLQRLRDRKVLDGDAPQSGTHALALLASHRLFEWAVGRCADALDVIAASDPQRSLLFQGQASNLWRVLQKPTPQGAEVC